MKKMVLVSIAAISIAALITGRFPEYDLKNKYNVPAVIEADIMELWTGKAVASSYGSINGGMGGFSVLGTGMMSGKIGGG